MASNTSCFLCYDDANPLLGEFHPKYRCHLLCLRFTSRMSDFPNEEEFISEVNRANREIVPLAEAAGYTIESDPETSTTFRLECRMRHSTKLGGVTIHLNHISRQATTTIDGLGKRAELDSRWCHFKLNRKNVTLEGIERLMDNPFRGTFCESLEDGWVEHGTSLIRHTDPNQLPDFGEFEI